MIYLLSKLLPLALLPLGLSLILLLVGLIGRWPVITAVVLLWVCSLGLVSQTLWRWLEAPWQRTTASEAPSAEAIVVLSGGSHPVPGAARVSEWHDPDRFLAGLDLYRAGKAPRLLFTGGASPFRPGQPPEGQRYLREAHQFGIPLAAMASTPPVVNTAEEAVAIRRLLEASGNASVPSPASCWSPVLFTCAVLSACLSARVSWWNRSPWIFRPAALGPGHSGVIPLNGSLLLAPLMAAPAPCASCSNV